MPSSVSKITGIHGTVAVHRWTAAAPNFVVLLAHGYGEHAARYEHLAQRLVEAGAVVYAPDHAGHGLSDGGRAHVELLEYMVADLGTVAGQSTAEHPGLPVALIGHSMGGIIATRYVQRAVGSLDALVLSGPVVGGNPAMFALLEMDPMPDVPLDPAGLSRDPAVGAAYAADPLIYHGAFRRESLQGLQEAVAAIAAGPSLGALPTLWIHGENDPLAPLDATSAAFAHLGGTALERKVYPGAMHEIFNETNRDEVVDDVVAFLRAQLRAA
ncbi:MAG: lysophospholipase [Pseudonocardia sp.]|nr:lysophospholipase [Pseudonocardia sp.]